MAGGGSKGGGGGQLKYFDAVFIDAYSGPNIPPQFLTERFISLQLPALLAGGKSAGASGGVAIINYCTHPVCTAVNPSLDSYKELLFKGFEELVELHSDDTFSVLLAFVKSPEVEMVSLLLQS